MDKYNVIITEPAAADMQNIANYIAHELREPVLAKKQLERIRDMVSALANFPMRHILVADKHLAAKGFRVFVVDNYIVFYIASNADKTVTIVRILYKRRDWLNLL